MTKHGYNTKQKQMILNYLKKQKDFHFTAEELTNNLAQNNMAIGKTTIYRFLNKLHKEGALRKYYLNGKNGACYQLISDNDCREHYHLKCNECGKLLHLNCDFLNEISKHVNDTHSFEIDHSKTVLYGKCINCRERK